MPKKRLGPSSLDIPITFRLPPQDLPPTESLYLTGSHSRLGLWDASGVRLERQDDGSWTKTVRLPQGLRVDLKITRGSWDTEALHEEGKRQHLSYLVEGPATLEIPIVGWRDRQPKVDPQIRGTLRRHPQDMPSGLKRRDIVVWLPESYEREPQSRYAVLYAHDGQNLFDPRTSYAGQDWEVDSTIQDLAAQGLIPEIIVVGIENTEDRLEEYSDTPKGRAYLRWIAKDLKPWIDATYRTRPEREATAVMGSSMGGLTSFLQAWLYPDLFFGAACLSPVFLHRKTPTVDTCRMVEKDTETKRPLRIYIDNGGLSIEQTLMPGCRRMLHELQAKGYRLGDDLLWFYDSEALHHESAWAKRLWRPLTFLFGPRTTDDPASLPSSLMPTEPFG